MSSNLTQIMIVPAAPPDVGGKGWLTSGVAAPVALNAELLKNNLRGFVDAFRDALAGMPEFAQGFKLDEIELVVEVTGEGSVQLVGGVKVGARGGITLKLKR
jgi:hypothetical protein